MTQSLDLNGTWQLGWTDGTRGNAALAERDQIDPARFFEARVPGEVHLDLERLGVIDDVRVGLNGPKARWVEETRWSYRKEFDAPPEVLNAAGAWLVFEGLDLTAKIVLNGQEVATHNNSYHPCRVNVAGKLRSGRNVLAVQLESGLFGVAEKALFPYQYLHGHDLSKRHWLRKAQCQFGWDWSTRLINVGIFKPVRLEWTDVVNVEQLAVFAELSEDLKRGSVKAKLFVDGVAETAAVLTATVGSVSQSVNVTIKPGVHPYEVTLSVDNPELWWPAEHGAQKLYPVRVSLSIGGRVVGERATRVGFRHIRFNQEKHPTAGRYFVLEVNGRKVFAKGANWAPADMILSRCGREQYRRLLELAREAHFNFFRINGCGIYEEDAFFEICDELGIMIWQDFPFTNTHYPFGDAGFVALVEPEARWNIRRMASHASLVAWCGNNEMAWLGGNLKTVGTAYDDVTFFVRDLARIVQEEDPTRYYQPSSPFSPDGLEPNANEAGNQHPWDAGIKNMEFHMYRQMTCRFSTEGGILGAPSLATLRTGLGPNAPDKTWTFTWQHHDNSMAQNDTPSPIDPGFESWIGKDMRAMKVEEYCYWGGLLQCEALREYIDNFRRRMFDSAAAVFWDFNDCWPVTRGWAIVDYSFRRAPSFSAVRRAFTEITVVVACDGDDVVVFGVNDGDQPCKARLRYGIFELSGGSGGYPLDQTADVTLLPNASTRLASFPKSKWADPNTSGAFAVLTRGNEVLARNRLFLPRFKDLKWPAAKVAVRVEQGRAVFESPTFAWGVCLDLNGDELFPDNFFDVYPGQPHAIDWPRKESPRILRIGNLA